jgi:MerR family regulatory protein
MQIGIVAKKIGLSVDAIRFYERNALLPRAPRTQGGFRQYAKGTWRHSLSSAEDTALAVTAVTWDEIYDRCSPELAFPFTFMAQ